MRIGTLAAGAVVTALAAVAAAGLVRFLTLAPEPLRTAASTPLLGVIYAGGQSNLGRLNPVTLKAAGPTVPVGDYQAVWARSPGGKRIALAGSTGIRTVDLRGMRVVQRVPGSWSGILALAWPEPGRILAVTSEPRVAVIGDGRVLSTRRLRGAVTATAHAQNGVAVLIRPDRGIGPARLALVSADGAVRQATLGRVRIGLTDGPIAEAGLAVDATGRHAYVVPGGSFVPDVDLATMAVTYHSLAQPISFFGRVHDWLEPTAEAKGGNGPVRSAVMVGTRIAVTGVTEHATRTQAWVTPTGLRMIDTRDWTVRPLDLTSTDVVVAGDLLFTSGSFGLHVYTTHGRHLRHLFGNAVVEGVRSWGRYTYAWVGTRFTVVDLATGRVLGHPAPTWLLIP